MADLTGPGAVVRIWSANPSGTLRFYFDGEETPRFTAKTIELLGGKVQPFGFPFAYEAAKGWDFYYPLPYAKSLKVTVDDTSIFKATSAAPVSLAPRPPVLRLGYVGLFPAGIAPTVTPPRPPDMQADADGLNRAGGIGSLPSDNRGDPCAAVVRPGQAARLRSAPASAPR